MRRFDKVLLVFPSFTSDLGSSRPSPSLSYLAQSLADANIEYDILDMMLGYSFGYLKDRIRHFKPQLIGLSLFTFQHKSVYELINDLKLTFPAIKIIVGGPHVSINKEKVLSECGSIDYACLHEGEKLLVELCSGDALTGIAGLAYRDNGRIVTNKLRDFEENLSSLSFPRLEKFELDKYANEVVIISSRGCPYRCIFCSVGQTLGRKVRIRSVGDVVDELEYWYDRGKRMINFLDDNFTFYPDRIYEICDEIERRGLKNLVLRCSNGVRADKLDRPLLERMWQVGFKSIGIGVEAGNNKVLKNLRKGETIEQIEAAIQTACDIGYEVALFFVLGTPGETLEDVNDSIRVALRHSVFKVDFYNLIPFPGTELYEWVNDNDAWIGDKDELMNASEKNIRFGSSPFFQTQSLSLSQRAFLNRKLLGVMRKVERNYLAHFLKPRIYFLSYPAAYLISTRFVQKLYFSNNKFRRIAEKLRYSLLKKK
jgi:anaerobic magnesium-protoporphyrin IX monomethyl ester cyclase